MKVLNFGSINVDYVYKVSHLVQPGETLSSEAMIVNAGGKGLNQSIALARAGIKPYHAGIIGQAEKILLLEVFKNDKINTDYIKIEPSPNGHAIIQVDSSGENSIILFGGTNQMVDKRLIEDVLSNFENGDFILLQNEISEIAFLIKAACERGLKIYFNPSPANKKLSEYPIEYVDTLILNRVEGRQITGQEKTEEIIQALILKYPDMKIVLTLGSEGSVFAHKDIRVYQNAFKTKAVDTTAAGDTFTGYLIASIIKGHEIERAMQYASAAASITISREGAAQSIPTLDEVELYLSLNGAEKNK